MKSSSTAPRRPRSSAKPSPDAELADVLQPGQSVELLKALHILTRDGKLNQDSRRKLKQVHHLVHFIAPLIDQVWEQMNAASGAAAATQTLTLADHGAGKSYLGFILRDLCLRESDTALRRNRAIRLIGVETRAELVERSAALAQELGFDDMEFHALSVADAATSPLLPAQIDIVTALHACDTATDDAIRFALDKQARHLVLVPCCQAEVAATLRAGKSAALAGGALSELWRHAHHTREFGSQITNVLRCLQLEASGYQVTVTELTGWEHSMKNELILATYKNLPRQRAARRLAELLEQLGLQNLAARFAPTTVAESA